MSSWPFFAGWVSGPERVTTACQEGTGNGTINMTSTASRRMSTGRDGCSTQAYLQVFSFFEASAFVAELNGLPFLKKGPQPGPLVLARRRHRDIVSEEHNLRAFVE